MQEGKPSSTAEGMAAIRSLESNRPDSPVLQDPMASWFVGVVWRVLRAVAGTGPTHNAMIWFCDVLWPGLVGWVVCRHRLIDDWLLERVDAGEVQQIVLIGAGYDSRFTRYKDRLEGIKLFEADHPATYKRKQEILTRRLGAPPEHVVYSPINLGDPNPLDRLLERGFTPGLRTFFIIEGVFYYLPPEAVETTLRFVSTHGGPGSWAAYDIAVPGIVDGTCTDRGAQRMIGAVNRRGEPFRFGMEPDREPSWLEALGLRRADHLDADAMRARYLGQRKMHLITYYRMSLVERA